MVAGTSLWLPDFSKCLGGFWVSIVSETWEKNVFSQLRFTVTL